MSKRKLPSLPIAFCATGKSGLGHLRRVCNIAAAIKELAPNSVLTLVTNAPIAGLSDDDARHFSQVLVCPRERMAEAVSTLQPGPVIIDTAVIPGIQRLDRPLCLILRETVAAKVADFRLPDGRCWDAVIVPSPERHWRVPAGTISTLVTHYVGWIYRAPSPLKVLPEDDHLPTLLIATGGGGTGMTARAIAEEIDQIVTDLRALTKVRVLHATGPRLPPEGRIHSADTTIDVGSNLHAAFAQASAVISTVGYNSILELAATTTPALLVPIERTYDDQFERAGQWGPALGHAHKPGCARDSAAWLARILEKCSRRDPIELGSDAATRAAEIILSIARSNPTAMRWFHKPCSDFARADAIARISSQLVDAGAPTLSHEISDGGRSLRLNYITGDSARQRLEIIQASSPCISFDAKLPTLRACVSQLARFHEAGHSIPLNTLPQLDAMAKVRSRLSASRDLSLLRLVLPTIEQIEEQLTAIALGRPAFGLVHGDFHIGQVMFPASGAPPIIIDLEDMAAAPPEFDVANFIAHMATSRTIYTGTIRTGVETLLQALVPIYEAERPDTALDANRLRLFCSAALLRRCLKLSEQRRTIDILLEIAITARRYATHPSQAHGAFMAKTISPTSRPFPINSGSSTA